MYNYYEAMKKDIRQYIADNGIDLKDYTQDQLEDELWADDTITGNGGLYYDNEDKCKEYLAGNNDLLFEAADEMYADVRTLLLRRDDLNRYCDCLIRCYLLYGVVEDIFNEYYEEHNDE